MTSNIVPKSSCFIPKVTSNTSGDVKKVQTQSVLNIPGIYYFLCDLNY